MSLTAHPALSKETREYIARGQELRFFCHAERNGA